MKNFNEIELTPEVFAKIEECGSAEELVKLAADNDVELSLADAEKFFSDNSKKLIDKVLDRIAAGGGENKYWCPMCRMGFTSYNEFTEHLRTYYMNH